VNRALLAVPLLLAVTHGHDRTPPVFAGLRSAATCIGGPAGGGRTSAYRLSWHAARDNRTPRRWIVYDVYQATHSRGERFARPTYRSKPGATTFVTPALPDDKAYYFVVRARDKAGNRDRNRHEVQGANLCV
jgi:hypothetical protein